MANIGVQLMMVKNEIGDQGIYPVLERIAAAVPGARLAGAEYWHVAKLKGELDAAQRQQLAALLEEVPAAASDATGTLFFVTPRIGTISPWSSKATDIAFNCDLEPAIERIERVVAFHVVLKNGRALTADEKKIVAGLLQLCGRARDQGQETLLDHGLDQPLLAAEVIVEQGRGHPGALGDGAQAGGLDALLGEQVGGDAQQLLALHRGSGSRAPGGAWSLGGFVHGLIIKRVINLWQPPFVFPCSGRTLLAG